MRKLFLPVLIFNIFLSGCLPFIKMESGRTLGKKVSAIEGTITSYGITDQDDTYIVPYLEVGYQEGITDKLDLKLMVNSIGFLGIDSKYQFIGDKSSSFASSIGLGVDALIFLPSRQDLDIKRNFKITIPLYNSYHFDDHYYYYIVPQFSRQLVFDKGTTNSNVSFIGVSTGIGIMNGPHEFNLGGAFNKVLSVEDNIVQYGVRYRYKFGIQVP